MSDLSKEFSIRIKDGSKATADALIYLFTPEGAEDQGAVDSVLERLDTVTNPMLKLQIGVALFGTQWEDRQ